MKNYSFIILYIFLLTCSCVKNEDVPLCKIENLKLTMLFDCERMAETRADVDNDRIADINVYLFPANGDNPRHIYLSPIKAVTLELPKGNYTLYALANYGLDTGDLTRDHLAALRIEQDPATIADNPFPMTFRQNISVCNNMQVNVLLIRAVSKVNFNYTVAPNFADILHVKSVRLCNVTNNTFLFSENVNQTADDVIDLPCEFSPGQTYAATYYLFENRSGQVADISDQQHKDKTHAPEFATYIYIEAEVEGVKVTYRVYLGENNTTDFNVLKNKIYNLDIHILGKNIVDWRVSMAEVSVAPFNINYEMGDTAVTILRLDNTNDAANSYNLSYRLKCGNGKLTIGGTERAEGKEYPLFTGNGSKSVQIEYTQADEGPVCVILSVTDHYGYCFEREVNTNFTKPRLIVTFTQEGDELGAEDRAYINFTISQVGYTGTYTMTFAGTPTVFYGRYGSDIPETNLNLPGNGSYTLRIKPEKVGPSPLHVIVTDQNANSANFQISITGVKTTAYLEPSFSLSGSTLDVIVNSTYPAVEDFEMILTANVQFTRAGDIIQKQYIVPIRMEAGRIKGRESVPLDFSGSYSYYSVSSYDGIFPATSSNQLVEYKLK